MRNDEQFSYLCEQFLGLLEDLGFPINILWELLVGPDDSYLGEVDLLDN